MQDHLVGPLGQAHRVDTSAMTPSPATLDVWWLHAPGQPMMVARVDDGTVTGLEVHVIPPEDAMDTFMLTVITLADLPGVPSAHRQWPWVTHELMIGTVDTSKGPVTHTDWPWTMVDPPVNVTAQFQVNDDDQARHLLYDITFSVLHGMLPPDVEAFVPEQKKMMTLAPLWQLWQDVVSTSAEHIRTGGTHVDPHPRG